MPIHTYAWAELLKGMREHGVTEDEIDHMARVNPARLLGLD
jgi:predicted metal-dependent phosphotriesterase family hydrolase